MTFSLSLVLMISLFLPATAQDVMVFSQMGSSEDAAREAVLDAVVSGDVSFAPVSRVFLAAPLSTRIAWIREAFAWARGYTAGPEFQQEYQRRRLESMPVRRKAPGSFQEELQQQKKEFDKQIREMRGNLGRLPEEMRPEMEKAIQEMEKQFQEQYGNPETLAMMEQGYQELAVEEKEKDEKRLRQFESDFPRDPVEMIVSRLKTFLELADSVDFGARTEMRDGIRKFSDPNIEARPGKWKILFRAGKAAVDTARAEARAWLKELELKRNSENKS